MPNLKSITERIEKLEQRLMPAQKVTVLSIRYVSPQDDEQVMAWENAQIGFRCVRLPNETEEQHYARAVKQVQELPLQPGYCAHTIYSSNGQPAQQPVRSVEAG